MSISITCDQCGKQYNVTEDLAGKRAKCKQCGAVLVIPSAQPAPDADSPLADLSALVDAEESSPSAPIPRPLATVRRSEPSRPVDGPSDKQFRRGMAVFLPLMILGMALCVATRRRLSVGALMLIAMGPIAIVYGIAGLFDPNIFRAAGKYGGHLPFRTKLIAVLVGLVGLACSLLLAVLLLMR